MERSSPARYGRSTPRKLKRDWRKSILEMGSVPISGLLLNEPDAAEGWRQRDGMAGGALFHRKPQSPATLGELFRMTAGERVAGQRGGWRDRPEYRLQGAWLTDVDAASARPQANHGAL